MASYTRDGGGAPAGGGGTDLGLETLRLRALTGGIETRFSRPKSLLEFFVRLTYPCSATIFSKRRS